VRRLRAALIRLGGLVWLERRERAFADEIESHLQMHVDDNLRTGMTPEEARRQALLRLGGLESTRQAWRERSTVPMLENLLRDARFALRQLARAPGFTATALVTLALGMGASLAVFGVVHAALIRPLPYPDPGRLVEVTGAVPQIPRANLSYLDYLDWKRMNTVALSLDVHTGRGHRLTTPEGTALAIGARVSHGFFRTLGVAPALGRDFLPGEDQPGRPAVVILSHAVWQHRYGADRDILGGTVTLDTVPHTIVGVLPQAFRFAPRGAPEFWTPLQAVDGCETARVCHNLLGVARLKDGVTIEQARAEFETIAARLEREYPDSNRDQGASVLPLAETIIGEVRPTLLTLLAGAALLLLIAGVNVSGLLLVRAESRRRELAVRSALGASRTRLTSQFVIEASVLVAVSSALALGVATAAMRSLAGFVPAGMRASMPYLDDVGLNGAVLLAACAIAIAATALFSFVPAAPATRAGIQAGAAEGSRGSAGLAWTRLGFKLVVVELATAMVLLASAGLLGQSLYRLLNVNLGFEPDRLAVLFVAAPGSDVTPGMRGPDAARAIVARAGRLPVVQAVGITSVPPVSFNGNTDWLRFVGRPYHGGHTEVLQRHVSPAYFRALGATLLRGRSFTDADGPSAPRVAIVNRTLAAQYFPGEDPIGRQIGDTSLTPGSIKEIVGIVDDIREGPLGEAIWPAVYYPFAQAGGSSFSVVARTSLDGGSVLPAVAAAIRAIDPGLATRDEAMMSHRISDSPGAYLQRSAAWLAGGFAALALLLAVIGLYGVMSYSVAQRTRELGVRLAIGAPRREVYRLVLRDAGRISVFGLALGLAGAIAAASLMRTLLFGISPWDGPTMAGVAVGLASSAMLASYFPARRAAAIDPVEALRTE